MHRRDVRAGFGPHHHDLVGRGQTGLGIGVSIYAAGKGAGISFMRHLAVESGRKGVTANTLALGLMQRANAAAEQDRTVTAGLERAIPVGRLGTGLDVGYACVYLASDEASWITGQTIGLNGGNRSTIMRFGVKLMPQHCSWDELLDVWRAADEHEVFESAWTFDHFYPIYGDWEGPCLEAWTTLGALAQATSRIRIGCMVNGIVYRHPAVLANMAAALDVVSGGRLELGLGAGWNERELRRVRHRARLADRAVRSLRGGVRGHHLDCCATSRPTSRVATTPLTDARCEPKGPQRPHPPIVIGGGGEKRTLRHRREVRAALELPGWRARRLRAQARGAPRALRGDRA